MESNEREVWDLIGVFFLGIRAEGGKKGQRGGVGWG
jgi:hypothetical protein